MKGSGEIVRVDTELALWYKQRVSMAIENACFSENRYNHFLLMDHIIGVKM